MVRDGRGTDRVASFTCALSKGKGQSNEDVRFLFEVEIDGTDRKHIEEMLKLSRSSRHILRIRVGRNSRACTQKSGGPSWCKLSSDRAAIS